ncbi:hypothetical protein JQX13_31390 [Archangium violaceum]|uniref:MXAN_2561 family MXYO-CTERM-anchored protein n=1 Tax=Archangium violaceum TaxID=83451 RepID=UPI00193B82DF|nr:MXAN_2561 family MXYO-CTERM-anchored protein [Archangium violaceum]QRK04724.1 hypothetical protein JQX13_31390 [Archangium violaceum]
MRTLLLTAALLVSSAAFGQIQIQSLNGADTLSVGPKQCGSTVPFNWTINFYPCARGSLALWITVDPSCKDEAGDQTGATSPLPSIPYDTIINQGGQGQSTFPVSDLPIFSTGEGGVTCGAQGVSKTVQLCASARPDSYGSCSSTLTRVQAPLKITYDTQGPEAPTITQVAGLDRALRINVRAPADANRVRVVVLRDDVEVTSRTQGVDAGSIRVENLENEVTYQVRAYAIDEADNESEQFATGEGTPTRSLGFYEYYREMGGTETGGCSATGGGLAGGAVLAVLGIWLSSRRNRS